ncbi:MAG: radical SAM protein [Zoogloeaceae bacterium]|nr:radical SAM protein [Zoogloeaceae bacterium]
MLADKLTFSINTRCTLKCRHCIHYINHFSPESRIDFPCERILSDVDLACAAHDFIRIGVIQGGEPFLHPDFSRILLRLCSKSNVGMVQIFSNGICRISEENFSALQNERVHVRISSYMGTGVLNQKQEALLEKNLHRLQKAGVSHTLYRVAWNLAPTLRKREYSAEVLQRIKENCPCLPDSRLVVNGIYSPCHYAAYIALHDLGDYAEDKVSLSPELPRETLRRRIVEVNERSYYQSCAHCDFSNEQVLPAEQGVDARYAHIRQMKLHHDVET